MSIGTQVTPASSTIVLEKTSGRGRWAGWLFGITIFLSAFLLFLVQPILGKIVLPWFGGSAGVWAACLLYFQASLLAGYAYAHCLRRFLRPKRQMQVHIVLLAASIALLPILPSPSWRSLGHTDPAIRILGLLAGAIGLPYLLICSTSPLLQAWYAAIRPGASAYRFYALSNLGSMLGLLSFPLLVEPRLTSTTQAWGWSGAYVVFVVLGVGITWYAWKHREPSQDAELSMALRLDARYPFATQMMWLSFAACGSALMMAVTNYVSQNLAPIPLLWILPLGLYLFSFVLCFDMERIYNRLIWIPAMAIGLAAMAYVMFHDGGTTNLKRYVPAMLLGMFSCCMVCHGELAGSKPDSRSLTYFYLLTSAGGVLGGFFVAIIAPHIFKTYMELPLWMVLCATFVFMMAWKQTRKRSLILKLLVRVVMAAGVIALAAYMGVNKYRADRQYYLHARNFYGALRVQDQENGDPDGMVRSLVHGTIEHGSQLLDPVQRHEPTLYYIRSSGVGLAMRFEKARGPVRVGAIGLGAGVIASYCRIGDTFRFYDINPEVIKIANSEFTFLRDCPGKLDVLLGDARLTLESQGPQHFDVLVVDAFSGDAIPIHLITREAFVEYFRHLNSDGILAIHVSNKYLDLVPVVARIAEDMGKRAISVYDTGDEKNDPNWDEASDPTDNDWVLVASKPEIFDDPIFKATSVEKAETKPGVGLWTDNFSNVLRILDLSRVSEQEDEEKKDP
ncbi:MAG TPA: fused MFS/spermidine synthase [Candidatus Angelobacter sp.]